MTIEVLYRDERLLVVNKPSGLLVHRGWDDDRDVAMTRARDLVGCHVHPVHRLDRPTSGALAFELRKEDVPVVEGQFARGEVEKRYVALCRGHFPDQVHVDHPVPKTEDGERVAAVTDFERVATFERTSLVRARPRTGRFHQIRRHLKHLSHPIVGDVNYGKGPLNREFRARFGLHRLALHALMLELCHPATGERLRFVAPLPADLRGPFAAMGLPTDAAALVPA